MTEADEKLSRLFAAETAERDEGFADAVEVRLRRARLARLSLQTAGALSFAIMAGTAWASWRIARTTLTDLIGPVPVLEADILGAPAPAVAVMLLAGFWVLSRRIARSA